MHRFTRFFPFCLLAAALCAAENPTNLSFLTQNFTFEPNLGQSASSALFLFAWSRLSSRVKPQPCHLQSGGGGDPSRSIEMNLLNAASNRALEGQSILPGKVNYFPSPDRTNWHTNIPTYERVAEHTTSTPALILPSTEIPAISNTISSSSQTRTPPNFSSASPARMAAALMRRATLS